MIISGWAQTDQGQLSVPMTGSVARIRRGGQILELSTVASFDSSESIAVANGVLTDWLFALTSGAQ
jgi:hypothetical protein